MADEAGKLEPKPERRLFSRSTLGSPWLLRAAYAVTAFLVFLCLATPPVEPSSAGLDPSWNLALQYFALNRRLVGVDYLFTYGPLSFLFVDGFNSRTFWWGWLWEGAFCGLVAVELVRLMAPPPRSAVFLRLAALAVGAVLILFRPYGDIAAYVALAVFGLVAVREPELSLPRLLLLLTALAALSLMKLSLLPLCLLVAALSSYSAFRRRLPLFRSPLILFGVLWTALWFLSGQQVSNLGAFFSGTREIIGGYAQAMGMGGGEPRWLSGAAAALAPLVGLLLYQGVRAARVRDGQTLALAVLAAGVAAVAYKQGFTRADPPHLLIFFSATAWISLLFLLLPDRDAWRSPLWLRGVLATGFFLSLVFSRGVQQGETVPPWQQNVLLRNSLVFLFPSESYAGQKEQEEAEIRKAALPEVRARVGTAPIDVWSYEQGWALLNGLQYRSRPVFQGYSAYTPALQKLNADFYLGPRAPEYVLFKQQTVDGRYPTLDDAQAFLVLLDHYAPVLVERECLLLRKRPAPPSADQALLTRAEAALAGTAPRTVRMSEWIESGDGERRETLRVASVTFSDLPAGKLWGLLVRPVEVLMEVETGASGAAPVRYRMLPSMTGGPFLLDPLLPATPDVLRLMRRETAGQQHLRRFRFLHAGWPAHGEAVTLKLAPVALAAP